MRSQRKLHCTAWDVHVPTAEYNTVTAISVAVRHCNNLDKYY